MYSETNVLSTRGYAFYKSLLLLYPESYRKKFGQEMLILFQDMYQEEEAIEGNIGIGFWLSVYLDTIKSALEQHLHSMKKQGMKKYIEKTLHINRYNIIGAIFLLPFLSVFVIDLISRIAQRDLVHYNRPLYNLLSHTFFYWTPILFIWVILFPIFAIVINLIPLLQNLKNAQYRNFGFSFLRTNVVTFSILIMGMGIIALVKLHDFAPCFVHGLFKLGIGQLLHIYLVCRNA